MNIIMPPDTLEWLMCSDRHITMVSKTTYAMMTKLIQLMLQTADILLILHMDMLFSVNDFQYYLSLVIFNA